MRPIAIMKLGSSVQVKLESDSIVASGSHLSGGATATSTVENNGFYAGGVNYKWLLGGSASNYEIYATLNSGVGMSGTFNSWLNLGTTQSWSLTRNTIGTSTGSITVQVRRVGSTTILATANITFECDVS